MSAPVFAILHEYRLLRPVKPAGFGHSRQAKPYSLWGIGRSAWLRYWNDRLWQDCGKNMASSAFQRTLKAGKAWHRITAVCRFNRA